MNLIRAVLLGVLLGASMIVGGWLMSVLLTPHP